MSRTVLVDLNISIDREAAARMKSDIKDLLENNKEGFSSSSLVYIRDLAVSDGICYMENAVHHMLDKDDEEKFVKFLAKYVAFYSHVSFSDGGSIWRYEIFVDKDGKKTIQFSESEMVMKKTILL